MTLLVHRRSRIPLLTDLTFGYVLAIVLAIQYPSLRPFESGIVVGITGSLITILLYFVEPFEKILLITTVRTLRNHIPSSKRTKEAFDSTFLDYSRSRIKGELYVLVTMSLLIVTDRSFPIDIDLLTILVPLVIISSIVALYFDHQKFPHKVLASACYFAAVRKSGQRRPGAEISTDWILAARAALESGNWTEVWGWLLRTGIPAGYKVPEEVMSAE